MITWSTADECLNERWADGRYVVDPDSCLRRFSPSSGMPCSNTQTQESLEQLDDPLGSCTYEAWCQSAGFDPLTREYS
jgi:hypothetical protein